MVSRLFNSVFSFSVLFTIFFILGVFLACFKNGNAASISREDVMGCGRRNSSGIYPHYRIIGGHLAWPGEYPWMVSINFEGIVHFCGGALIHPEWVLTAAHCLTKVEKESMQIIVGSTNFTDGSKIMIAAKESYTNWSTGYDIGLIRLERPVTLDGTFINTVCLPNKDADFSKRICSVSGWGNLDNDTSLKPVENLHAVDIPIWSDDDCIKNLSPNTSYNAETMICAGDNKGRDACVGDSGSPLVCQTSDESFQIVGIVSKGVRGLCGDPHFPGIYTRVPYFLEWIKNITELTGSI